MTIYPFPRILHSLHYSTRHLLSNQVYQTYKHLCLPIQKISAEIFLLLSVLRIFLKEYIHYFLITVWIRYVFAVVYIVWNRLLRKKGYKPLWTVPRFLAFYCLVIYFFVYNITDFIIQQKLILLYGVIRHRIFIYVAIMKKIF